jgi:hypothetical protein
VLDVYIAKTRTLYGSNQSFIGTHTNVRRILAQQEAALAQPLEEVSALGRVDHQCAAGPENAARFIENVREGLVIEMFREIRGERDICATVRHR